MFDSYVPYEVLRKLPYEYRIPVNYEDELELMMEMNDECGWGPTKGLGYNCIGMND